MCDGSSYRSSVTLPIEVFQFQTVLQYIHECYEIIALLALWVLLTDKITKINDNSKITIILFIQIQKHILLYNS